MEACISHAIARLFDSWPVNQTLTLTLYMQQQDAWNRSERNGRSTRH
jgi:hypothetical protein